MKANELRIGNLVGFNGKIEEVDVLLRILKDYGIVVFVGADNTVKMEYLQPIPLTEEILLKCGFEQDDFASPYIKYKMGFFEMCHDINKNTFLIEGIKYMKVYVKSLHQLQNLYFAFTGEELTVNI